VIHIIKKYLEVPVRISFLPTKIIKLCRSYDSGYITEGIIFCSVSYVCYPHHLKHLPSSAGEENMWKDRV